MTQPTFSSSPAAASPFYSIQDDCSVATPITGSGIAFRSAQSKEYVVKFTFIPSSTINRRDNVTALVRAHYAVLASIKQLYGDDIKLFSNYNKELTVFDDHSPSAYARHFLVKRVKSHRNYFNTKYVVHHRFQSTRTIREIKRQDSIMNLLKAVNIHMSFHPWHEDEVAISSLGFFIGLDPINHLQDDTTHRIRKYIANTLQVDNKKIPKFKLIYSSPSVLTSSRNKVSTKAYEVQVKQQDAKMMLNLLQRTYQDNVEFVFHDLRYKEADVYQDAIQRQNAFLQSSRVVPIQGIPVEIMSSFESQFKKLPGVIDVLPHNLTNQCGRWNILTDKNNFHTVTSAIKSLIQEIVCPTFYRQFGDYYPSPTIAFHFKQQNNTTRNNSATLLHKTDEQKIDLHTTSTIQTDTSCNDIALTSTSSIPDTIYTSAVDIHSGRLDDIEDSELERLPMEDKDPDSKINSLKPPSPPSPSTELQELVIVVTKAVIQVLTQIDGLFPIGFSPSF